MTSVHRYVCVHKNKNFKIKFKELKNKKSCTIVDIHNDLIAYTFRHHQTSSIYRLNVCSCTHSNHFFLFLSLSSLTHSSNWIFFEELKVCFESSCVPMCMRYFHTCTHFRYELNSYGQCFWVRAQRRNWRRKKEILIGLYEWSCLLPFYLTLHHIYVMSQKALAPSFSLSLIFLMICSSIIMYTFDFNSDE